MPQPPDWNLITAGRRASYSYRAYPVVAATPPPPATTTTHTPTHAHLHHAASVPGPEALLALGVAEAEQQGVHARPQQPPGLPVPLLPLLVCLLPLPLLPLLFLLLLFHLLPCLSSRTAVFGQLPRLLVTLAIAATIGGGCFWQGWGKAKGTGAKGKGG